MLAEDTGSVVGMRQPWATPRPPSWSDEQHRIPITVEPVPLGHRLAIRLEHQLTPAERADQHEQGRLRQVEVGEQPAHHAKSKTGVDEEVRVSGSLAYTVPVRGGDRLERTRRRRADRNDAAPRVERSRDRTGRAAADLV